MCVELFCVQCFWGAWNKHSVKQTFLGLYTNELHLRLSGEASPAQRRPKHSVPLCVLSYTDRGPGVGILEHDMYDAACKVDLESAAGYRCSSDSHSGLTPRCRTAFELSSCRRRLRGGTCCTYCSIPLCLSSPV